MERQQRIAVVPGSFDPITKGHMDIIRRAKPLFDKVIVLVVINAVKNPCFSLQERVELIRASVADIPGVEVDICEGYVYKYCVKHGIFTIVRGLRSESEREYENFMADYNKKKGGINTIILPIEGMEDVSSTALRAALKEKDEHALNRLCAPGTAELIQKKFGEIALGGNYD